MQRHVEQGRCARRAGVGRRPPESIATMNGRAAWLHGWDEQNAEYMLEIASVRKCIVEAQQSLKKFRSS
jgi:hypothetical protein